MTEELKKEEAALDMMTNIRVVVSKMADVNGEISKLLPSLGFPESGEEFAKSRVQMWKLLADYVEEFKKLNDL
jgi:hypothetical protein